MNRAVAAVLAISIRHKSEADKPYTDEQKQKLLDCIPALVDEVNRMDKILRDPFIRGYLERFPVNGNER